ncbi:MAG: GntR family transcriptional regulator [Candidatus Dormibacteria bacterium]
MTQSEVPGEESGARFRDGLLELERASLRDRALLAIRGSIITGELEEGTIYPVAFFAARLAVSATPIREALFDLASEGLIEVVRNRGFRVPHLSEHDLDELLQLRLLVELAAAVEVAQRGSLSNAAELRTLAQQLADYARSRDVVNFLWADRTLHLGILRSLGNRRLVETVASLRDQARLHGIVRMAATGTLGETAGEHVRILDAIEAGDPVTTERLMRDHLGHTRGLWAGIREGQGAQPGTTSQ